MSQRATETIFRFGPFRLDCGDAQLFNTDQPLALTPKAFAVLESLLRAEGSLVTKDQLFDTVWAGTVVTEAALTVCIREIRKALGDSSSSPQFIATVHKRGYRFVAPIELELAPKIAHTPAKQPLRGTETIVERKAYTGCLWEALERVVAKQRQTVFVTGEAGIGKTTLVEACLRDFSDLPNVRIARGQCVEHHGCVEPYLPWLDAITRLCLNDSEALTVFRDCAPLWLLQIPVLLPKEERTELERRLAGTNTERMLREMLEALQVLAAQHPLVIYLDDLQFSDMASIELLASLARRQEAAHLLFIGSYRPADVIVAKHPLKALKQELEVRGQCTVIALELFSGTEVRSYIAARLPRHALPNALATAIHKRTDGNPLFTLNVIEYLLQQNYLQQLDGRWQLSCELKTVETCVPESLVQMLGYHIEQLTDETQAILQAAAVASDVGAGDVQFSTLEVAAALQREPEWVEEHCDTLAQQGHFLRCAEASRWPGDTMPICYAFTHGLYQKAFYRRLPSAQRARFHQRIGACLADVYGAQSEAIAAALAVHFEQGRDSFRAATYLMQSAAIATRRGVNKEARHNLEQAVQMLRRVPDGAERTRLQIQLYTALATACIAEQGNAAPEVKENYNRAQSLCERIDDALLMFPIVFGLRSCSLLSGQLEEAHRLSEDLLTLAKETGASDLLTEAHVALASTAFFLGRFEAALAQANAGLETYAVERHAFHVTHYWLDPGVFCHCRAAQTLWALGFPGQAQLRVRQALGLAQRLEHPYSLVFALNNQAWVHMYCRKAEATEHCAAQAARLAVENGFAFHTVWAEVMRGWAVTVAGDRQTGLALMHEALESEAPIAEGARSYLLTALADACLIADEHRQGTAALDAVVEGAEHFLDAERLRLRGDLLLGDATKKIDKTLAEECFVQALYCARQQQAPSLQLRVALSLANFWVGQGRYQETMDLLTPLTEQFEDAGDNVDLMDARALLKKLRHGADSPFAV